MSDEFDESGDAPAPLPSPVVVDYAAAGWSETGAVQGYLKENRRCGYSQCARPLPPHEGLGRPAEYCKDRFWHEPGAGAGAAKGCAQMAKAERAAERAAGLDVPLDVFRTTAAALLERTVGLGEHLATMTEAVTMVEAGALARIAQAEEAMRAALEEAARAEQERDRAVGERRAALEARDDAVREQREKVGSALRERGEAIASAAAQVREAREALAAAERARGASTEAARAAAATCAAEAARREEAETAAAEASTVAQRMRHERDVFEQKSGSLLQSLVEAQRDRARADEALRETQRQADALRTQVDDLQRQVTAAVAKAATQSALVTAAQEARTLAEQRATSAEARLDRVLDAIGGDRTGSAEV